MERMRRFLAPRIPSLNGIVVNSKTCMYTTTPDENFVVAAHPEHPMVTIAAGFSGHGFKFSSVVGEILADLVTTDSIRHDIRFLSPKRFKAKKHSTL